MWVRSVALVGGGLVAGGILAGTLERQRGDRHRRDLGGDVLDQPGGGRADRQRRPVAAAAQSDEQLLTGDTATKVTDAALAKYPGATIQRVETDSDGVYEAHIVTADGEQVIVQVGADFTVTGTQSHG